MWGRAACALLLAGCDLVFPIDSSAADSADLTKCPASYVPIANAPSRYQLNTTSGVDWYMQEAACEADSANGGPATHLVVVDDSNELTAIVAATMSALSQNDFHTGFFREGDRDAWQSITGGSPMIGNTEWLDPLEPMDQGEAASVIVSFDGFGDGGLASFPLGDTESAAVCECDGHIVSLRPSPNL